MNGTKKLYYDEPYLAQFCAKVLSCTPLHGGQFAYIDDQYAFVASLEAFLDETKGV